MSAIINGLQLFFVGVADSLNPVPKYEVIRQEGTRQLLTSLSGNSILLLFSVVIFESLFKPYLSEIKIFLPQDSIFSDGFVSFLGSFSQFIFYIGWVYPMYFLWILFISTWHEELAKHTYGLSQKKKRSPLKQLDLDQKIEEAVHRGLFTIFFIIQRVCFASIPYIGSQLDLMIASIYYSFLCFEPRWRIEHIPFYRRSANNSVDIIHFKWPYYLGFGLPLCLFVKILSFPFPDGVYLSLLPLVSQLTLGM
jgi:hypothetical protein